MLPTGFLGFCRRVSLLFPSREPPGPSCGQVLIESFFLATVFEIFRCRQGRALQKDNSREGGRSGQEGPGGGRDAVTLWSVAA